MNHASEIIYGMLVARDQASEVLKPGEEAFDFPSTTISAQRAPALSEVLAAAPMRGNHFNARLGQFAVELI